MLINRSQDVVFEPSQGQFRCYETFYIGTETSHQDADLRYDRSVAKQQPFSFWTEILNSS